MCSFGATEHQSSPIFAFLPIFSYTKCPKVPICARPIYSPGVALQNASGYSIFSGRAKGVSFPCGVFLQRLMRELQNPKVVQIFYTMLLHVVSDLDQWRLKSVFPRSDVPLGVWTTFRKVKLLGNWNFGSMNRTFKREEQKVKIHINLNMNAEWAMTNSYVDPNSKCLLRIPKNIGEHSSTHRKYIRP